MNCPCRPCSLPAGHGGEYHYALGSEFTTEAWVRACRVNGSNEEMVQQALRRLRPTRQPRMAGMMNRKLVQRTVLSAIVFAVLVLVGLAFSQRADAHLIRPAACDAYWRKAPPGERWAAKQRCLAYVYAHNCRHGAIIVPRTARVKGVRVDSEQRRVIGWLVQAAYDRRLPRVFALSAIATTTQEASARELDHGEGSSVGPFQLIDTHGSAADRRTIEFSGNWFYNGAVKVYYPGMGPVALSHAVQRSAYPSAVGRWIPEANTTLAATLGHCRLR